MKKLEDILWNELVESDDNNDNNDVNTESRIMNFNCLMICCSSACTDGPDISVSSFGCP